MTKRHFEALAWSLAQREPKGKGTKKYKEWEGIVEDVAEVCALSNSNFSFSIFRDACSREYWEGKKIPSLLMG